MGRVSRPRRRRVQSLRAEDRFSGRLVRFADAGLRHRGLRSAIAERTGQRVPPDAYLLVDGQAPDGSRAFAMLWLMFVGFAIWNVATIVRLVRKVK